MTVSSNEWQAWESELDRLITSIEKDAKAGQGEVVEMAIKAAEDALAKAAARIAEIAATAEAAKDTVETAAGHSRAEVERAIRDKPLTAVAVAAAAGFLLALLVRR